MYVPLMKADNGYCVLEKELYRKWQYFGRKASFKLENRSPMTITGAFTLYRLMHVELELKVAST